MTADLTKGRPLSVIFRYSLPLIAGQLFQLFYTLADTLIVGQTLGASSLAAVGATSIVTYFQLVFIQGFTNGMGIITGQCFGSGNEKLVKRSIAASNMLGLYASILLTLIFSIASVFIPDWMNIPEDIQKEAWIYMFVIFLGSITTVYYNIISNLLRALGDSRTPLIFLVISSILNIVLDIVAIVAFRWGVAGAAIATVFSQGVSTILCYLYAKKHFEVFRSLSRADYKAAVNDYGKHLRMALPMGLQMSVMSIGQLAMQSAINSFGTNIIAGYTAASKVDQMSVLVNNAFSAAVAGFVSQNYGAGDFRRVRSGVHASLFITEAGNTLMGLLVYALVPVIPSIFLSSVNAEIVEAVRIYVLAIIPFYYLLGFISVYRTALQAVGNTAVPFAACIIELIARIVAAFVFKEFFGFFGACFANSFAWIGASILLVPFWYRYAGKHLNADFTQLA